MGDKRFGFELVQLCVLAWFVVLYTLLTPLLLYSVYRYTLRDVQHRPFIHARRPKLVLVCCTLTIAYCSIYAPILLLFTHFPAWFPSSYQLQRASLPSIFAYSALPLFAISTHFSIRFFQVHYDLQYNSSMADQIWTQAINTKTRNFYIAHRAKYGQPRFQYVLFCIFLLIFNSALISMLVLYGEYTIYVAQIVILTVLTLNMLALLVIFRRLTSFLDVIKIRTELLWNIILTFLDILVIAAHSFLCLYHMHVGTADGVMHSVMLNGYSVVSVISSLLFFCICYMQTLYIILQPEVQQMPATTPSLAALPTNSTPLSSKYTYSSTLPNGTPLTVMHSVSNHQLHRTDASRSIGGAGSRSKGLQSIFKNDETFKLFIRHLAKEYCIENALFLFESQQFKLQCNVIENEMHMMQHSASINLDKLPARISVSKSGSNSKRNVLYSKKAKNLLSVPPTVREDVDLVIVDAKWNTTTADTEMDAKHSPCSPPTVSEFEVDPADDHLEDMIRCAAAMDPVDTPNGSASPHTPQTPATGHSGKSATRLQLKLSDIPTSNSHSEEVLRSIPFHLIPTSQIIEKYQNDLEKIYLSLYEKYVDWKSSSFEINVSSACRNRLHNIYVRITYQLLMEEREQLLLEQEAKSEHTKSNFLTVEKGWVVDKRSDGPPTVGNNDGKQARATVMWQSRKTIVNALKATIVKQQMSGNSADRQSKTEETMTVQSASNASLPNIDKKVEIGEVVEVLSAAQSDIIHNLKDSFNRFKLSPEFNEWLMHNASSFGLNA